MAGKMFFIGGATERNVLLNPGSIPYIPEYLLVKRHPGWVDSRLESEILKSFLESTRNLAGEDDFPMSLSVKLKAYLSDPSKFSLTDQEKQSLMVDLIPLIAGKIRSEEAWGKVGLKGASYRRKAEAMMFHVNQHRNWIVPYPIDGLKALLKEGMIKGTDAYEKNWCALQSASILMYEGADMGQVKLVLAGLKRDREGRVLLQKGDEGLWERIEMSLKKHST